MSNEQPPPPTRRKFARHAIFKTLFDPFVCQVRGRVVVIIARGVVLFLFLEKFWTKINPFVSNFSSRAQSLYIFCRHLSHNRPHRRLKYHMKSTFWSLLGGMHVKMKQLTKCYIIVLTLYHEFPPSLGNRTLAISQTKWMDLSQVLPTRIHHIFSNSGQCGQCGQGNSGQGKCGNRGQGLAEDQGCDSADKGFPCQSVCRAMRA